MCGIGHRYCGGLTGRRTRSSREGQVEISLNDAYALSSPEQARQFYAKWAATYETEFVVSAGYLHPRVIAEIFDSCVPDVASAVDAGAGTGLVGAYLCRLRPALALDGIDLSAEMLAVADAKGVYRHLYERDLTRPVLETAAPYDALISIGLFTHGHLGPEALANLLPLVRPGGYAVIGANESHFLEHGFEDALVSLGACDLELRRVHVYDEGSEHRDSLNVVSIFRTPVGGGTVASAT